MFKLRGRLATTAVAFAAVAPHAALAGEVAGTVVDQTDTIALQAATVRIAELNRQAVTGPNGTFIFADVPAGTYTIQASYVGAETETLTIEVPATGTVRADFSLGGSGPGVILVIGQAANQASALSRKRASDVVSDVLTRDAIGQFPDQNVAESLRRLPGVNVLNDQGEGRFVSVRGLDPDLVSTSLNGVRLPAPESDVRSVALDVISSDVIESITVKKSLTPDMDADTIGASVEIETTSAFARRRNLFTAKLEGSYNDYSGELTPKGSVDFAARLTDGIGVTGGLSYYQRKFETDNMEADDWVESANGPFSAKVEHRDYDVERERISATLGFDFRIGEATELYARGIYSQFDDQEFRRGLTFDLGDFEDDGPSAFDGTLAQFSDADQEFDVEREIKDRFESQKIRSLSLGGKTDTGTWFAEYSASWAKSSELEDGSVDPTQFSRTFYDDGLVVGIDYSNPRTPLYSIIRDPGDFFDPSTYELNDVEYTERSDAQDEEWAAKLDLGREFATDSGVFTVQGGAKARWRDKTYNKDVSFWENDAYTLADVAGEQTYRIAEIGPVGDHQAPRDFFLANMADFEEQEIDGLFDSAVEDFAISEDVMAGYLLGRWDSDTLRVIGGVRYERTDNEMSGNTVTLVEEGGELPGGGIADEDMVVVAPVDYARDYDHWLPSLNVRFEPQRDLVFRAAGYRSIVRPKLGKLAPRFAIEQSFDDDDGQQREGEFGNPDLLPYEAWNFDASAEYYFSGNGAISGAVFYKDVKNFIVDTVREEDTFRGIAFDEAIIPINGDSAEIYGFELSLSQAWTMLPAPFDGLITQLNYTYTDATGRIPNEGDPADMREITLPVAAKHTLNGVLGFEKGPFSFRLAGTYRDSYLDEAGSKAELDRFVDDHFQLDLSARYSITDNVQLFYEWININDAEYFAYNTLGSQRNLYQFERYNWTMKGGIRLNF